MMHDETQELIRKTGLLFVTHRVEAIQRLLDTGVSLTRARRIYLTSALNELNYMEEFWNTRNTLDGYLDSEEN